MNKTTNYQLNQWERSDRVLMEDFNADNEKIDAALAELAKERIRIGSYVGSGADTRTVSLPWAPVLILLLGRVYDSDRVYWISQDNVIDIANTTIYETPHEFAPILKGSSLKLRHKSWCNHEGVTFRYMLFR